jgi:hypothetical protein
VKEELFNIKDLETVSDNAFVAMGEYYSDIIMWATICRALCNDAVDVVY